MIFFIFGRSGSGKSTLAKLCAENTGAVKIIEGEEIRKLYHYGHDRAGRMENVKTAATIARHEYDKRPGQHIFLCLEAPSKELRQVVADTLDPVNFKRVFINCSYETCYSRDPKGLYARCEREELKEPVGVFTMPKCDEVDKAISTDGVDIMTSVNQLWSYVLHEGVN